MVRKDVKVEPVLQDITWEELNRSQHHPGLLGYSGRGRGQLSLMREFATPVQTPVETWIRTRYSGNRKQRRSASTLVFSTTAGIAVECKRYHSRLAELVTTKKGKSYATTMSRIRTRVSFALLRSALLCVRHSRRVNLELSDINLDN